MHGGILQPDPCKADRRAGLSPSQCYVTAPGYCASSCKSQPPQQCLARACAFEACSEASITGYTHISSVQDYQNILAADADATAGRISSWWHCMDQDKHLVLTERVLREHALVTPDSKSIHQVSRNACCRYLWPGCATHPPLTQLRRMPASSVFPHSDLSCNRYCASRHLICRRRKRTHRRFPAAPEPRRRWAGARR